MIMEIKSPSTIIDISGEGERMVQELLKTTFGKNIQVLKSYDPKKDGLDFKETFIWKEKHGGKSVVGLNIWHERVKKEWTQKQLSKKSGIPQTAISQIEKTKREPGLSTIKKLAKAFDVDYRYLLR